MSRPFVDKSGVRLAHLTARVTEAQRAIATQRGGSAYLRLVLSTPVQPQHKLPKPIK